MAMDKIVSDETWFEARKNILYVEVIVVAAVVVMIFIATPAVLNQQQRSMAQLQQEQQTAYIPGKPLKISHLRLIM